VSDIDTAAADSLKVLDPKRPIREADIEAGSTDVRSSLSATTHTNGKAIDEKALKMAIRSHHEDALMCFRRLGIGACA